MLGSATATHSIIGFCEILIEDAKDSKQDGVVNDLEKIHKSGIDLLALINDILDLSKIEAGKFKCKKGLGARY